MAKIVERVYVFDDRTVQEALVGSLPEPVLLCCQNVNAADTESIGDCAMYMDIHISRDCHSTRP